MDQLTDEEKVAYDRAVETEGRSMRNEPEAIRRSWNLWWALLERDKRIWIEDAPTDFRDNEEFVIKALRDEADNIKYASYRLRNDKDVCLAVLYENHNLLTGYEGETILNDYDFMIKIIREYNWENVKFASKDLRNNKDFMRSAIRVSSKAKSYLGDKLLEDESFMEDIERL